MKRVRSIFPFVSSMSVFMYALEEYQIKTDEEECTGLTDFNNVFRLTEWFYVIARFAYVLYSAEVSGPN